MIVDWALGTTTFDSIYKIELSEITYQIRRTFYEDHAV